MTPEQSFIRFIPRAYKLGQLNTEEKIQGLVDVIDGLLGRSSLAVSSEVNAIKKAGLYERSDFFHVLSSLSRVKKLIQQKQFHLYFDGSVTDYIQWFCRRFEIYLDNAWISHLSFDNPIPEGYLSLDDVFAKLAWCLYLARKRGTKLALMGFLKVYLPSINKNAVQVYDGGKSHYVDVDDDTEDKVCYVFVTDKEDLPKGENCDFSVQIIYHGSSPEEMDKFINATKTIVDREKPAHTRYCYNVVAEGWILPSPRVGDQRSILNNTTLLSGEYTVFV